MCSHAGIAEKYVIKIEAFDIAEGMFSIIQVHMLQAMCDETTCCWFKLRNRIAQSIEVMIEYELQKSSVKLSSVRSSPVPHWSALQQTFCVDYRSPSSTSVTAPNRIAVGTQNLKHEAISTRLS